jgi:hypothetical protein
VTEEIGFMEKAMMGKNQQAIPDKCSKMKTHSKGQMKQLWII